MWGPTSEEETTQGSDLLHPKPGDTDLSLTLDLQGATAQRRPEVWGLKAAPLLGLQGASLQAQPHASRGARELGFGMIRGQDVGPAADI